MGGSKTEEAMLIKFMVRLPFSVGKQRPGGFTELVIGLKIDAQMVELIVNYV